MGTPITPSPISPTGCTKGDGILWAPGCPPLYLSATISDILTCPWAPYTAPAGVYVLEADPIQPCVWFYRDAYYTILMVIDEVNSYFRILTVEAPYLDYFYKLTPGVTFGPFLNYWTACKGPTHNYGAGGIVNCIPI